MRPITDLLTGAIGKTGSLTISSSGPTKTTTASPTQIPRAWIAALFAKLAARYGHKWVTSFPPELQKAMMAEWRDGLAGLTADQMRRGLDTWDCDWPPCLPEFRRACLGQHAGDWQHRGPAYKPFPPALPKPRAKPETATNELAKIRHALHNRE